MSRQLDIDASLRRRQRADADAAPGDDESPGEAAWNLPDPAADAARPGTDGAPAGPQQPESRPPEPIPGAGIQSGHIGPSRAPPPAHRPTGLATTDDDDEDDPGPPPAPAFPPLPGFGDDEDQAPAGPDIDIMRCIQKRIATLEQLIEESNDEVAPENEYRLNPKREELSLRAQTLEDDIKVAEAQAAAVKQTLDEARSSLNALTVARTGYQELTAELREAEQLVDKLAARQAEVRVALLRNNPGFSILERATPPIWPEPSLRKLVAAAGVILGGGLGLFVALVLEFLDPIIRTARDAKGLTGCELVLEFQQAPHGDDAVIDHVVPTAPVSTLFRTMINDLRTALAPRDWRSLAITSAEPASGRSLVAVNLASALALKDELTLLVDADVRADAGPRPESLFGVEALHPPAEITDVLAGAAAPEDAYEPTTNPYVRILSAGDYEDDRGLLLLGSRGFKDLTRRVRREGEHVLYDLPPINAMEAVIEAAAAVGNVLLVARSGHTRRADLKAAATALAAREIPIRAVIVTGIPRHLIAGKRTFEPPPKPKKQRGHKGKQDPVLVEDDLGVA